MYLSIILNSVSFVLIYCRQFYEVGELVGFGWMGDAKNGSSGGATQQK